MSVFQAPFSDGTFLQATNSRVYFVDNGGAPTAGTYNLGDIAFPSPVSGGAAPTSTAPAYWRCTVAGTPGTWTAAGPSGGSSQLTLVTLSGSTDAIPPHTSATYVVTTAGVDAMTLAAPTTGAPDNGKIIRVTSGGAYAHTITATGLFNTGSASVNLATFAAYAGATVELMAYNAKWNVLSSTGVTFS